MSYKVSGYYTVQVDEDYDDEADAYARAREIVAAFPNAAAYIKGGGIFVSLSAAPAEVEA